MPLTKTSYSMIEGAVYNVLDFGAVGDGVIDCTTAIQAALDTAFNAGGGTVFVPAGTYKTSKPLIVRTNTVLEGTGFASKIAQSANFNGPGNVVHIGYGYEWNQFGQQFNPAWIGTDATMAELLANNFSKLTTVNAGARNLYLEGYINGNRPGLGLWFINALNCFCEYIWTKDVLIPVTVGNDAPGWQAASANTTVSNVYQVSCDPTTDGTDAGSFSWFDLMYIGSSVNTHISRLFNNPNTPAALKYMIQAAGGCNFTITDSVFSGTKSLDVAVGLFSNSIQNMFGAAVCNNIFENLTRGVFLVGTGAGGSQIKDCSVVGNAFRDCAIPTSIVGATSGNNNISSNLYTDGSGAPGFGPYLNTTSGTYTYGPWFLNTTTNTTNPANAVIQWNSLDNYNGLALVDTDSTNVGRYTTQFIRNGNLVGSIQTLLNSTVYVTTSDHRLKENVKPISDAFDRIMKLNPVSFTWKSNGDNGESFIAHELQAVFPAAVTGEKDATIDVGNIFDSKGNIVESEVSEPKVLQDGQSWVKTGVKPVYQGIDTSVLVPALVAAIQQLKTEFEAYKASHH